VRVEFKTEKRGYILMLDQDLFGAFILYRQWWGLLNRRGGTKRQVFFDQDTATREFRRIQKTRLRRGYVSVDRRSTDSP
jgi:predicted DNA-binding WGR domain protein